MTYSEEMFIDIPVARRRSDQELPLMSLVISDLMNRRFFLLRIRCRDIRH